MNVKGHKEECVKAFNRRQVIRQKLAIAWLKENKPLVWEAIVQEAINQVPLEVRGVPASKDPKVLKFLSATKEKP